MSLQGYAYEWAARFAGPDAPLMSGPMPTYSTWGTTTDGRRVAIVTVNPDGTVVDRWGKTHTVTSIDPLT